MQRNRGFTLIELMIVMLIGAVLLAIAVPSFVSTLARAHARDMAQSIATGLDWAKANAVSSAQVVTYQAAPDCSWQAQSADGINRRSGSATMPFGVQCSAANTGTFYFLPNGAVTMTTTGQPALTKTVSFVISGGGNIWSVTLNSAGIISNSLQ